MKDSKTSQKAKLQAWKDSERQKSRDKLPFSDATLESFFAELETLVDLHGCAHTTVNSQSAIGRLELSPADGNALLAWCVENGGFCDCEILSNSQDHWLECRARP